MSKPSSISVTRSAAKKAIDSKENEVNDLQNETEFEL